MKPLHGPTYLLFMWGSRRRSRLLTEVRKSFLLICKIIPHWMKYFIVKCGITSYQMKYFIAIALFFAGEVKTLLLQLLKAVAHMHDNWILHRDLKTSNLLLSHKGILKVGLIPYIERKYSRYWIRHDYIRIIFLCVGNSQWCVYILCTCTLRNTKSNKVWLAVQHSVRCTASWLVDIGNKDRATLIINMPHSATWLRTARFITSFWVFRFNSCITILQTTSIFEVFTWISRIGFWWILFERSSNSNLCFLPVR